MKGNFSRVDALSSVIQILIKLGKRLRFVDITTQKATRHDPSPGYWYLVRVFDRYLQSLFELQDGRMYNCNRFRERSMGMEQGRARIYSEASPPEIYGSPDSSAVGKTAKVSPCWQRSGLVSNLSRALEFTELRRSHWRSCASSKRLSWMSTKNGAGDQIWQYKTIHSINLTSFTCKMELVVDLQAFTKPINEFVLKELAALEVNNSNNAPVIILFEPPCDWNILPAEYKVTNSWLQRSYHGIREFCQTIRPILYHMDIRYKEKMYSLYLSFCIAFLFVQPYEIHGIGERGTSVGKKGRDRQVVGKGGLTFACIDFINWRN